MAALVAWESLRSYNKDVCVAPSTTRWVLLDERVARSSCCSSQPGSARSGRGAPATGLAPGAPRPPPAAWGPVGRESGQIVLRLEPTGLRLFGGSDHRQRFVPKATRTPQS